MRGSLRADRPRREISDLLCWINKRLETHSDTRDWQTIRRLLGRKPSQPDDEQKRASQMLGIDWKSAFPTKKIEIPA